MDGSRIWKKNIDDQDIITDALKLWKTVDEAESDARDSMLDDIRFEHGEHWDEEIRRQRTFEGRPCLTVPRLDAFLNKVRNENRQNKNSIKVSAGDGPGPEKIRVKQAERRQQRIRKIEYDSCAQDTFQKAYDYAVGPGRGFFRIKTEYADIDSFKQKIVIEPINDPLSVYMDTSRTKQDYSDCKFGFILKRVRLSVFKEENPEASESHFTSVNFDANWLGEDWVTIAEFYCTWVKERELWLFDSGEKMFKDEIEPEFLDIEPVKKRKVKEPFIMWYKMTSQQILDRKEIPGKYIPIIAVVGKEEIIEGEIDIWGMTRKAKDCQKMYDYWSSAEAERLQLSIKSEYVVADGQIKGYEKYWKDANKKNFPYLPYKPQSVNGTMVPPPMRQMPKQVDMAIVQAKVSTIEDMKSITGIYDPGLGAPSNETSGRAILARQRQSDMANYHYLDGMRMALTQAGKIIMHWITVYDEGPVKGLDDEEEETSINLGAYEADELVGYGEGEFNLVVSMSPNYLTARQESLEMIMELMRIVPQVAPLVYDIFVKNIDSPGSQEIAARLRKTIPPDILEAEGGEEKMQIMLQEAIQQVQKDKMMIQALQHQLQQVMQKLEGKEVESATKLKVAEINSLADIEVANIKAQSEREKERGKARQLFYKAISDNQKTVGVK